MAAARGTGRPENVHERRVGTIILNKWTVLRLIGVGGMAAVYVGVHRIGRHDALKILHADAARLREVCLRFEREAHAVNRFRHPGVVEIRDIDVTEDGAPFLVMEVLEGETFGDRLERLGPLSPREVAGVAESTLDVLVAAHAQGIIHRDIKPANLFRTTEGELKVLDFGLARVKRARDGLMTREGTALGTTPYMAPEQARGRSIDERADVFAVGATMFRLLTGRYLHDAEDAGELLRRMGRDPPPPLAAIAPSLPRELGDVVDRALRFDREERYATAGAMLAELRHVTQLLPVQPEPSHGAPTRQMPSTGSIEVRFDESLVRPTELAPSTERTVERSVRSLEGTLVSPGQERKKR